MLGFHSDIFAGPEFDHLPSLMRVYREMVRGIEWRQSVFYTHEMLRASVAALLGSLLLPSADKLGKRLISEKTPDNVQVFDDLGDILSEAKFVFVVRDPRAVIHSMQQVGARAAAKERVAPAGRDLLADLDWINRSTSAGDCFAARNPGRCIVVHYETLVSRPEETLGGVCRFLGLKFDPQMLRTDQKNEYVQPVLDRSGYVWYTPEMYNSAVDPSRSSAWEQGLGRGVALLVEDYFARRSYACHEPYALRPASRRHRLTYLTTAARYRVGSRLRAAKATTVRRMHRLATVARVLRST